MSQALPYSLEQLRDAFGYVESTNNYGELGPITESGNRAYGRYQVMDFNIPSWTEQHLGQRLTPEQYLASPEAQDAVFMGQMGDYYARSSGSPAERVRNAGSLWFTGRPFSAETAGSQTASPGRMAKFYIKAYPTKNTATAFCGPWEAHRKEQVK